VSPATPSAEAVRTFLAAGKLSQAAPRCLELGDAQRASELFEQACAFAEASHAATRGGDWRRAARLAALAADDGLVVRALDKLVSESFDEAPKEAVALTARGQHRYAAWVFDRIGDMAEAASAYERAELPLAAAHAHARGGQIAKAARLLESAIHEAGDVGGNSYRVALGELYALHGKHEAAANHLQAVPHDAPERPRALELLCSSLDALGLRDGITALEAEQKSLGDRVAAGSYGGSLGVSASDAKAGSVAVTIFGRYRVLREVAVTPHARLLHAIDELTGEEVAVKWLAATGSSRGRDALARFVREAQALAELRHPAIVGLRDYIERGPAMVLEWMSGGELNDILDRETFAPARAAQVANSILAALGVAHRIGILHRDVKPANLLFDGLGAVHLADFGAAHWSASQATVTEGVIGTLAYMAPEQRRGEAACAASDVYAVGVILHEMLTGSPPDGRTTPSGTHPDLTDAHDAVVQKMLCDEVSDRYASVAEAQRAMARLTWSKRIIERKELAVESSPFDAAEPTADEPGRFGVATSLARRSEEARYLKHDRVLDRDVLLLPATAEQLTRAGCLARATHPAVPAVWGMSDDGRYLIVEPALGEEASSLSEAERARLSEALTDIHEMGGIHGSVAEEHVRRFAGQVYLAYVIEPPPSASEATDREQLRVCKLARS